MLPFAPLLTFILTLTSKVVLEDNDVLSEAGGGEADAEYNALPADGEGENGGADEEQGEVTVLNLHPHIPYCMYTLVPKTHTL